jgi:hypothetical protein
MEALLNTASAACIPILGYISSARLEQRPAGEGPRVRLRGCVVGPGTVSGDALSRLAEDARHASPIAQLLGDRLEVEWDLRLLLSPAEPMP